MALGDFTKENAVVIEEALDEMFKALSKPKQREYLGHLNEICLFVTAAKNAAPTKEEAEKKK